MSFEEKMKATMWNHTAKHEPSVVCSKDMEVKGSQCC